MLIAVIDVALVTFIYGKHLRTPGDSHLVTFDFVCLQAAFVGEVEWTLRTSIGTELPMFVHTNISTLLGGGSCKGCDLVSWSWIAF